MYFVISPNQMVKADFSFLVKEINEVIKIRNGELSHSGWWKMSSDFSFLLNSFESCFLGCLKNETEYSTACCLMLSLTETYLFTITCIPTSQIKLHFFLIWLLVFWKKWISCLKKPHPINCIPSYLQEYVLICFLNNSLW